ncbi:uncharacterized protein LOC142825191 [Pelodiscus sinensis]|uniref:uncharacterized protein LOC142825191 n=1 Tax=Pelodiscus sinensis TaxID=13735 RepID=UPI003F6C51C7
MRWRVETLGLLLAVTQGLVLQTPAPLRGCPPDPLGKISAKIRHMDAQAKELFALYMAEQRLNGTEFSHLCHEAVPWLPTGPGPALRRGALPALARTLQRLRGALQTIGTQQQVLSAPGAALHETLYSAQAAVGGLLSNVACALEGAVPPAPVGPGAPKLFHQRIEGCKVLRSYSQFLEALVKRLQRAPRALAARRKGQRGARRNAAPAGR